MDMLVRVWLCELLIAVAFLAGGSAQVAHAGENTATVTGVIFWDRNGDGSQDPGEPGFQTNPVLTSQESALPLVTGFADDDGRYEMQAEAGTYRFSPGVAVAFESCAGVPLPSYNPFGFRDCVGADYPITSERFTEPFDVGAGETITIDFGVTTRDEMILLGRALYDGGNVPSGSVIKVMHEGTECGTVTVADESSSGGGPGDWVLRALGAEQRIGCYEPGENVLFELNGVESGEAWSYQRFSPVPTLNGEFGREGVVTVDISFLQEHAWFWADDRLAPDGSMIAPGTPVRAIFPGGIVCGETQIGDGASLAGEVSGFSGLLIRSANLQPGCGTFGAPFQVAIGDIVTYDVHWYPAMFQVFGSDASEYPLPTPDSPPPFCEPIPVIPVDPGTPLSPPPSVGDNIPPSPPPGTVPDVWPQSPPSGVTVAMLQETPLSPPPASPPPADVPLSPPRLSPPPSPPPTIVGCPVPGAGVNPPDTGSAGLKETR